MVNTKTYVNGYYGVPIFRSALTIDLADNVPAKRVPETFEIPADCDLGEYLSALSLVWLSVQQRTGLTATDRHSHMARHRCGLCHIYSGPLPNRLYHM